VGNVTVERRAIDGAKTKLIGEFFLACRTLFHLSTTSLLLPSGEKAGKAFSRLWLFILVVLQPECFRSVTFAGASDGIITNLIQLTSVARRACLGAAMPLS
jgi:hypothetical protein